MNDQQSVVPFDLHRLFIGDLPWSFTGEVVFRTVVVYLFTLLMVRMLSRQAIGQLSIVEFLMVIALGSAVGDSMFYPDVPLLHAFIVIAVVVFLNRGIGRLIMASERFETFIEGTPVRVIRQGRIDTQGLALAKLNKEKLFELLRERGVAQLGEIEDAYLEQRGSLSIVRRAPAERSRGLPITPPWDLEPPQQVAADEVPGWARFVCAECGNPRRHEPSRPLPACERCQGRSWVPV